MVLLPIISFSQLKQMNIEIGKTYSENDLEVMYGPNWRSILKLDPIPRLVKPIIDDFKDFDSENKSIFIKIHDYIQELNPDLYYRVYACGSRVKGYWKTIEEAKALSIQYGRPVKPSDYDYWTLAPNKPTKELFYERLNVVVDFNKTDKQVLITK